jgi:cobalt-zinc-cadmium efflux system outer membrane protein
MSMRRAAFAAALSLLAATAMAGDGDLSLDDAFGRAAEAHPDLRLFVPRRQALDADAQLANQTPPLALGVALENAPGSGALAGFDGAELTLTLAGVLERGGKREARRALAAARIDAQGPAQAAARLDLLAEVARRYLELAALQARRPLLDDEVAQRRAMVAAARARFDAGAAPEAAALAAEAALARAEVGRAALDDAEAFAWRRLALLWADAAPGVVPALSPLPQALSGLPGDEALRDALARTPELQAFAAEERLREARLQLARSGGTPDLDWQLGIRQLQDGRDQALVASLSLPLGMDARTAPAIAGARAEQEALALERESAALRLEAVALEALAQARTQSALAMRLSRDVLPRLQSAAASAATAYRAGALAYLEWAAVQADVTATRIAILDARAAAQRALVELQRLTAEPWLDSAPANGDSP